ncbi:hypothetical protein RUM44_003692 [Polyplax serrata]|uniref:Carboxylesterase type B domain-containing protein n=1 Tax=Polyplax serrata TaxID=468196 RepID=A0ABR1AH66_POLSC
MAEAKEIMEDQRGPVQEKDLDEMGRRTQRELDSLTTGETVTSSSPAQKHVFSRPLPDLYQKSDRNIVDSEFMPVRLGSVRGESIIYLLGLPLVEGHPFFLQNFTKQDVTVTEAVLNYFTNFAKTGNPNEPRNQMIVDYSSSKEKPKYRGITWESYEVQSQQYLSIIGIFIRVASDVLLHNFWEAIKALVGWLSPRKFLYITNSAAGGAFLTAAICIFKCNSFGLERFETTVEINHSPKEREREREREREMIVSQKETEPETVRKKRKMATAFHYPPPPALTANGQHPERNESSINPMNYEV